VISDTALPSLADLTTAARLLGCELAPDALPDTGLPGDLLVVAALVLGAAEVQVVNAELHVLDHGGTVQDVRTAADLTALVAARGSTGAARRWLLWHTGRLVHQLWMAESRAALPHRAGLATAHSVVAAHHLLRDLASAPDDEADISTASVSADAVAQAREALLAALDRLVELVPAE